jgi:ATP-dependent helicase/nuclease subunit B
VHELAAAHAAAAEALAAAGEASPLWQGEAGEAAAALFEALTDPTTRAPRLRAADYADFYRSLVAHEAVRSRLPARPRLFVWGPFEARLQQPDVLVLGSLNEGTWPAAADPGPWLNRPMRRALGLPAPEAEIGRSAHDFVSLCGAQHVYLTRAEKQDGAPTVPSRWLMRLKALLGGLGLADALAPEQPWLAWARARDAARRVPPIAAPAPCPPLQLRPRRLSVSKVETWISNPYAIFAGSILQLEPLPALGEPPGAGLRGSIVHEALAQFALRFPAALPADPEAELIAIARAILEDYTGHPRVAAFWLPRFERFARWFAETEPRRRVGVAEVLAEVGGKLVIDAPEGPFTLTCRADRIDLAGDGLVITDYKTGAFPNDNRVAAGLAPQLPLEAAIAAAEGFPSVGAGPVRALRYIRASGAAPPGEEHTLEVGDVAAVTARARAGLTRLIALYDDPATPYAAVRRASFLVNGAYRFDPYAHLARVAEWSARPEEAEE